MTLPRSTTLRLLAPGALAFLLACGGGGGASTPAKPAVTGPALTIPPKAQAGYVGDQVTFRVAADGTGNAYQWFRNGVAISGATSDSYVLGVQAADDQARYSVRVTGTAGGTTTSAEVLLDVLYADPAVAAGHDHALAITTKGKVYAWGVGGNGQLGLGDYQARNVPTAVTLPGPAVKVAAGWGHSLALLADGRVFAWGNNASGQLGDGTTTMRNTPAAVPGLTGVIYITCGYNHNLAVKSDQSMWVWGYNSHGQLGLGDKANRLAPTQSPISAQALADATLGELHTLLVGLSGDLYGAGDNGYGQLGFPYSPTTEYLTFTQILGSGVKGARAFSLQSVVLGTDGLPYGTGENVYGQLGDGSFTTRYGFVPMGTAGLTAGSTLDAVIPGQYHTHLLNAAGDVASTGYNWYGQLGFGTATTASTATPQALTGLKALGLSAGSMSTYAVLPDLTVKAWGYNNNGRLGDGTATDRPAPTTVPNLFLGPIPTGVTPPAPAVPEGAQARGVFRF
ncbi:MAG: repeat-containing protein [Holophagaceae bacterium]|nr:repeat-containing protein [Holophagaceae bacterium]